MATITPLGVQLVNPADPARQRPSSASPKNWRTNLTGLSSLHNLYFVACAAHVLVYEPHFPNQDLPSRFALVLETPPSRPGLRGYLDPLQPHTINNLIVDHLGSEEIVAVVRDDGDVDAYFVRHVAEAIDQRKLSNVDLSTRASELRPILHRNVANSAWGLAVHTSARLIAVSSNNHEINVFAFGLANRNDSDEDGAPGDSIREQEDSSTSLNGHASNSCDPRRDRDEHICIPNGGANIPYVAFCNTGDDPEGRWLLSTDISGLVRAWDLTGMNEPQGLYVGRSPASNPNGFNRLSAGWTASFLDSRAFQEVEDLPDEISDIDVKRPIWDLSPFRLDLGDVSATLNIKPPARLSSRQRLQHEEEEFEEADLMSASSPLPNTATNPSSEVGQIETLQYVPEIPGVHVSIGTDDDLDTAQEDDEDDFGASSHESQSPDQDEDGEDDLSVAEVLDAGPPDDLTQAVPPPRQRRRRRHQHDSSNARVVITRNFQSGYFQRQSEDNELPVLAHLQSTAPLCDALPCPVLLTSVEDMYLLQPVLPTTTSRPRSATGHFPLMFMGGYFRQSLSNEACRRMQGRHDVEYFERCSLLTQIPSLGVVVVGNQKGRVAVLSGWKCKQRVDFPVTRSERLREVKWIYGMKLEALLPFASQEWKGYRPMDQLYGVAAARMQGCVEGQERWRLMMMYVDETTLSYEITRKSGHGREFALDVI